MATITLHLGHGTCIRPICTYKLVRFQSENGKWAEKSGVRIEIEPFERALNHALGSQHLRLPNRRTYSLVSPQPLRGPA